MAPNFKNNSPENNFFRLHYDQKNTLNPLVKSVFKSVHNHGRYLQFCDRHVCSIQNAATRRPQLRAWPILCTGLCPVQLFLVNLLTIMGCNQVCSRSVNWVEFPSNGGKRCSLRFKALKGHWWYLGGNYFRTMIILLSLMFAKSLDGKYNYLRLLCRTRIFSYRFETGRQQCISL